MTAAEVYVPDTNGDGMTGDYIPDAWLTLTRKLWPNTPDWYSPVLQVVNGTTWQVLDFSGVQGSEIAAWRYAETRGWEYVLRPFNLRNPSHLEWSVEADGNVAEVAAWIPLEVQPATQDRNEFARLALPAVRANTTEERVRRAGCTECGETMHAFQDVRRNEFGVPRARCKPSCDTGDALDVRGVIGVYAPDGKGTELDKIPGSCSALHAFTLTEGEYGTKPGTRRPGFVNLTLLDVNNRPIGSRTVYAQPKDPAAPRPALRGWHNEARVRFLREVKCGSPEGHGGRTYTAGEVVTMHQTGGEGRVPSGAWWSCLDVDLAYIVDEDAVEVVTMIRQEDPYRPYTFRELVDWKYRNRFDPYTVWLLAQAAKEARTP